MDVFEQLRNINFEGIKYELLDGGCINCCYKVNLGKPKKAFFCKVYSDKIVERSGERFQREAKILQYLRECNYHNVPMLFSSINMYSINLHCNIMSFIEAKPLSNTAIGVSTALDLLMKLRQISIPTSSLLLSKYNNYTDILEELRPYINSKDYISFMEMFNCEDENLLTSIVHGDFRFANILVSTNDSELYVVDWETCHVGIQEWDVATIIREFLLCNPVTDNSTYNIINNLCKSFWDLHHITINMIKRELFEAVYLSKINHRKMHKCLLRSKNIMKKMKRIDTASYLQDLNEIYMT